MCNIENYKKQRVKVRKKEREKEREKGRDGNTRIRNRTYIKYSYI